MKKLLSYFLVGLFSHNLWAASQVGLLWQLTSPQSPPSHLFATYHTEDPRALEILSRLTPHLEQTERVAFELLKDIPTLRTLAAQFFSKDNRGLDTLILPQLYREVERLLQSTHHFSPPLIQQLQPWAVITLLNTPPIQTGKYADWRLYEQVMKLGKAPYPLEKVEEHLNLFAAIPLEQQGKILAIGVQQFAEISAVNQQLIEHYLGGDLKQLSEFLWNHHPVYNAEVALKLKLQREMQMRNKALIQRMKPLLENGNTIFILSALRLGGNMGILQLLEQEGYQLTAQW